LLFVIRGQKIICFSFFVKLNCVILNWKENSLIHKTTFWLAALGGLAFCAMQTSLLMISSEAFFAKPIRVRLNQVERQPQGELRPAASRLPQKDRRPQLFALQVAEIDSLLRETAAANPDFLSRLSVYSELAKGTPYRSHPLGEGAKGKYDRHPLINFSAVDCLTYCEQILAMALADSYEEMFQCLQRLRYRDGVIDIRCRNHFTVSDWLPNNSWLVQDATEEIGAEHALSMTKTIDRVANLRKQGVPAKELTGILPPEVMTVKYIPEAALPAIAPRLRGGEIACVVQSRPGIFIAHLGFVLRDSTGRVFFRNASARRGIKRVVDEDFDDLVKFLRRNPSWVGMIFLRVRPEFMHQPEAVVRQITKPSDPAGGR
jgi:hypothetical protein